VHVENALQPDQQPTTLSFTAYVNYQLAPHTLSSRRLGEILPTLTDGLTEVIERGTDYHLRELIADGNPTRLDHNSRKHLEHQLKRNLRKHLKGFGVAILSVQLVIWPPAGLYDRLTVAEQERVNATLQADQLATMVDIVSSQPEAAHDFALMVWAYSLGRNTQTLMSFDATSLPSFSGAAPNQASTTISSPIHPCESLRSLLLNACGSSTDGGPRK
jgi:hypothetical protein